ncbi:MAG: hypothetical protein OXB97_03915, partial [Rhodospirillales bacterium]|nr:hypothetical protein [Rhodospirillales bacterium]
RIAVAPDAGGVHAVGIPSRATFDDRREALQSADEDAIEGAHEGWTEDVRGRGREADVPQDVGGTASAVRAETEGVLSERGAEREGRAAAGEAAVETGREDVEEERTQPMGRQVLEEVPLIGGWLAGRLYGTARNTAPDAPPEDVPSAELLSPELLSPEPSSAGPVDPPPAGVPTAGLASAGPADTADRGESPR